MIVFDKDLASDKVLWVFNNNIIKFHDDSGESSVYAVISSEDFTTDPIYPNADGLFTFNFQEYLKVYAVKNRLADVISPDIDNTVDSLVYDDTENIYYLLNATITITRTEAEDISTTKAYEFFTGVEQLDDYQRQEQHQKELFALHKLNSRNNLTYYLNYWKGYPFNLSIYSSTHGDLNIKNLTNLLEIDVPISDGNKVNRIAFSDAVNDITIDDYLPLKTGLNKLQFTRPGFDSENDSDHPIIININKRESDCGYYIKYRTASGGWAYWLFHKYSVPTRRVSDSDEINNDFENIEDDFAPSIQTGVSSSYDSIKAYAKNLNHQDLRSLMYIIESPKIYLFTGEPYAINQTAVSNQWIEIACTTSLLNIKRPQNKKMSFTLDFKLPKRKKVTLL